MKAVYQGAARLMGMDDAVWRRHANPWAGLSRFTALPLLVLAIWSRVWIGSFAWLAVGAALVWIWWNPRAFAPPSTLNHWVSRADLGEQVFLHRRDELPRHHLAWADGLSLAALPGVCLLAWGLWRLDPTATLSGMALTVLPKLWFCDRMVWLYADWCRAQGKELGDV